jgi:hypothetical protein
VGTKSAHPALYSNRMLPETRWSTMEVNLGRYLYQSAACQGRCEFLVVRSISDRADEKKRESRHSCCSKISADLVASMIEDETI